MSTLASGGEKAGMQYLICYEDNQDQWTKVAAFGTAHAAEIFVQLDKGRFKEPCEVFVLVKRELNGGFSDPTRYKVMVYQRWEFFAERVDS